MSKILPKYPIFIPSHKRSDNALTPKLFMQYGVPFKLVVDKSEYDNYAKIYGDHNLLVLPFLNNGTPCPPRVWIMNYSRDQGDHRHWIIDDNIRWFCYFNGRTRIQIQPNLGLRLCEEFCDQWTNVGIYGPYYSFLSNARITPVPFRKNVHVYSCMCVLNSLPFNWRGPWNEDVDLCLQSLAHKYCTIGTTFITQEKMKTMSMKGGNSTAYQNLDSRAYGSRVLQRRWPSVVELKNKYGRPHFHVKDSWRMFKDIPLVKDPNYKPKSFNLQLQEK